MSFGYKKQRMPSICSTTREVIIEVWLLYSEQGLEFVDFKTGGINGELFGVFGILPSLRNRPFRE